MATVTVSGVSIDLDDDRHFGYDGTQNAVLAQIVEALQAIETDVSDHETRIAVLEAG